MSIAIEKKIITVKDLLDFIYENKIDLNTKIDIQDFDEGLFWENITAVLSDGVLTMCFEEDCMGV